MIIEFDKGMEQYEEQAKLFISSYKEQYEVGQRFFSILDIKPNFAIVVDLHVDESCAVYRCYPCTYLNHVPLPIIEATFEGDTP